jgi:hypothetical protein
MGRQTPRRPCFALPRSSFSSAIILDHDDDNESRASISRVRGRVGGDGSGRAGGELSCLTWRVMCKMPRESTPARHATHFRGSGVSMQGTFWLGVRHVNLAEVYAESHMKIELNAQGK